MKIPCKSPNFLLSSVIVSLIVPQVALGQNSGCLNYWVNPNTGEEECLDNGTPSTTDSQDTPTEHTPSGNTPSDVVKKFFEAVKEQDSESARNFLVSELWDYEGEPNSQNGLSEEDQIDTFTIDQELIGKEVLEQENIDIQELQEQEKEEWNNYAEVTYTVQLKGGQQVTDTALLVREDDNWKILFLTTFGSNEDNPNGNSGNEEISSDKSPSEVVKRFFEAIEQEDADTAINLMRERWFPHEVRRMMSNYSDLYQADTVIIQKELIGEEALEERDSYFQLSSDEEAEVTFTIKDKNDNKITNTITLTEENNAWKIDIVYLPAEFN